LRSSSVVVIVIEAAPIGSSVSYALLLSLSSLAVHKGSELTEFERNGAEEEVESDSPIVVRINVNKELHEPLIFSSRAFGIE
jgi:hypothetical protein